MHSFLGPPASPLPMQPFPPPTTSPFLGRSPMMGPGMAPRFVQSAAQPLATIPGQVAPSFATQRVGGGLLSRLFGGAASRVSTGSITGGSRLFGSGMNLTTILNHTQRVLGITQQVAPMIQQYGPLIKNAPTLWRILRSSPQPADDDTAGTEETIEPETDSTGSEETTEQKTASAASEETERQVVEETQAKPSDTAVIVRKRKKSAGDELPKPKLYV
ncbi:YqfQ family protein [Shouchella tritolerans]|uniref:YqfQ family protein n=1 Tax=Shouchella tritolerans TaxID=2979466 RepID=UPI0021E91643|nr:YqfQ family protein [Shouchella tritolerans]